MKKAVKKGLVILVCIIVSGCLAWSISDRAKTRPDRILEGLSGMDVDYLSMVQGASCQLPLVSYCFKHPEEIELLSCSVSQAMEDSRLQIQGMVHHSFELLTASAGGFGPPLPGTQAILSVDSPESLSDWMSSNHWIVKEQGEWNKLPFRFKQLVVENLASMREASLVFEQFAIPVRNYLEQSDADEEGEQIRSLMQPWELRELHSFSSLDLPGKMDLRKLSLAARIMSAKLDGFLSLNGMELPDSFNGCSLQTDFGVAWIGSPGNDTIQGDYILVVETGGDDVYLGETASTCPGKRSAVMVVDLEGDDRYLCGEEHLVAGILGMAVLADLEGDDCYHSGLNGLAFSLYGFSMLYDLSGNDGYFSHAGYSQAASVVGSALLVDLEGSDHYSCKSHSQAFASTMGAGIFYDGRGDDRYNMDSESGELSGSGSSFIQGAARGRWAQATDGQNLAGGLGLFLDQSGNDEYAAGSFSQGASYYFGLGIFRDLAGGDAYNAISHAQGYAAHYSLGGFFDEKGDDTYNASSEKNRITQLIGSGRDLSIGLFMDKQGHDTYHFGNRSVGISDMGGIGVAADGQGNDKYYWHRNALNEDSPSLGAVLDVDEGMATGSKIFTSPKNGRQGLFLDHRGDNIHQIIEQ